MAKFTKGNNGNPSGRPKGAVNKLHKTVKETVLNVFNTIQGDPKAQFRSLCKVNTRKNFI